MAAYELPEGLLPEKRRQHGVFYTPEPIVDFMVAIALEGKNFPLSICDYSCGGGAFLAGVMRYFKKKFPQKAAEYAEHIYGIDIDPAAIKLAMQNLPEIPEKNFICADSLDFSLPENRKFDIIIGNPPYRCGGLRNSATFPAAEQQHLKAAFPYGFEYKMNLFALFTEQSLNLGRESCLIVPDSLLCGKYFSKLRRHLTENFSLYSIWLVEKPAFDASPGNCVIIHTGRKTAAKTKCGCFRPKAALEIPEDVFSVEQNEFLLEPRCRFQLAFSQYEYDLLHKIMSGGTFLSEHIDFASGIIAKKGKNSIISSEPGADFLPGIICGREITPFEIHRQGFFISSQKEKIKSGFNPERFAAPKIFLRQTGSSLIAACTDSELYALNNCHIGTAKKDFPVKSVTALLNSSVLNFVYRYLSGERNRNFAQIDIDILNTLPLRRSDRFDRFAAKCMDDPEARQNLDREAAMLYGISDEELVWIRKEIHPGR